MKWISLFLITISLPLSSGMPIHEWEREVHYRNITLYAPAVAQLQNGSYYGVLTEVNVTMMNGTGNVFVVTTPLTQLD
ncbi:MAG TPA: ATP-dependent protease, partial [Thermoplasmatales archaeon]|nr:ATP-dependent protease [Thermoplasmatales archaeon]